jgi:hypothetical protein
MHSTACSRQWKVETAGRTLPSVVTTLLALGLISLGVQQRVQLRVVRHLDLYAGGCSHGRRCGINLRVRAPSDEPGCDARLATDAAPTFMSQPSSKGELFTCVFQVAWGMRSTMQAWADCDA